MTTTDTPFTTYTGIDFDLFNPTTAMVNIQDIAHSLSNLCRFTGHSKEFYSVAQHCVLVSRLVPLGYELRGLLHEGEEPYTNDLSTPLKYAVGMERFREIGHPIKNIVLWRFGLEPDTDQQHAIIKDADNRAFAYERSCFITCTSKVIEPLLPKQAEQLFLARFSELFKALHP